MGKQPPVFSPSLWVLLFWVWPLVSCQLIPGQPLILKAVCVALFLKPRAFAALCRRRQRRGRRASGKAAQKGWQAAQAAEAAARMGAGNCRVQPVVAQQRLSTMRLREPPPQGWTSTVAQVSSRYLVFSFSLQRLIPCGWWPPLLPVWGSSGRHWNLTEPRMRPPNQLPDTILHPAPKLLGAPYPAWTAAPTHRCAKT